MNQLSVTPNNLTQRWERALSIALISICVYFALSFLFAVFANYWPGPFVDYWIDIPNVEKFFSGQLTFQDLISAHANVHRLFIPRLLFIADYRFFSGSNVLLIWASIACKVATLLLFNHIIKDQPFKIKLLLNAIIFAAILNAANLSNVLHNSNMQWDLASVFSCFALYFYSQNLNSSVIKRCGSIATGLFFFACGFLSQAGALSIVFVFIFISLLNKKWLEGLFSITFAALVMYLTFFVLPVNEPQNPTYESALAMMVFKLKFVVLYVFKMFSGSLYAVDHQSFIFSWIMLLLFILSLTFSKKTKSVYNNLFLSIALFSFLMMVTIAAARVDFAPNAWPANRYQTNTLLFILSLSLHGFFSVPHWFNAGKKYRRVLRCIILAICFGSLLISQYFLNHYAFVFGNKVFSAQTYMLFHGVNQQNGANLLPSLQEQDRIAEPDPFFREHGFAYYSNKQGGDTDYKETKRVGANLIPPADLTTFIQTCSTNSAPVQYTKDEYSSGYAFSTALNTRQSSFLKAVVSRNTYYVLDANGAVLGFSYILIDADHPYSNADIKGFVSTQAAKYIAEIDDSHPRCLYSVD